MATQEQVLHAHRDHPSWTDAQIAAWLDCSSGYVRRAAQRLNLTLPKQSDRSRRKLGEAAFDAGMTLADIAAWRKYRDELAKFECLKGDHQE